MLGRGGEVAEKSDATHDLTPFLRASKSHNQQLGARFSFGFHGGQFRRPGRLCGENCPGNRSAPGFATISACARATGACSVLSYPQVVLAQATVADISLMWIGSGLPTARPEHRKRAD
jgi:hypothetical protein